MGAGHSREGKLDDSDSEEEEEEEDENEEEEVEQQKTATPSSSSKSFASASSKDPVQIIDSRLDSLSLGGKRVAKGPQKAKLYRHLGGNTPKAQWVVAEKAASWEFSTDGDDDDADDGDDADASWKTWYLLVGSKVRARVSEKLQAKFFGDQLRVDFVYYGVWALKFPSRVDFLDFETEFQNCLFENTFMLEATEENKIKVFGKDFMGWAKPEEADDSVWEDAEDTFDVPIGSKPLREDYVEPSKGSIQSLTMGALDHSFLVSAKGIEAVRNLPSGIQGKGVSVVFNGADTASAASYATPKKAMLLKGESNLMVLSPTNQGTPHSSGVHQLDVGTGKIVAQWKFEKDGTPITMRDVTNESKGAQLDPTGSTFLGLDDNRLCRWDMRDRHGIVQQLASPVLDWTEGHQFSRGTNFQCFASTGDGAIVVGSKDGKVRLYGTTSMRMAKTAFPGLGSPITHIDVTYDGKWILATTDAYMILISTVFKDKDGKSKTGFTGRMGNNIAAPRLLKLSPLDAHLAGKNYKFQNGQFSWVTESGRQERNLVATIGNFTVVWNFRRVKESNHECYQVTRGLKSCYCYRIIPKEESIVDSKFMHDSFSSVSPNAPLVVATPKNVSSFNVARD